MEVTAFFQNMPIIEVYIKQVYGVEHVYIKNKELAKIFASLTGQKTVTSHTNTLKRLGFKVVVVSEYDSI